MKKVFVYFFAFIFICFVLPALLTKRNIKVSSNETKEEITNTVNEEAKEQSSNEQENTEQNSTKTIQLLHKESGQVEEVELEKYLCNVVSAEMPADYEIEALKAQAIVARTYTIYKMNNKKHENADICDDSACCQAWITKENRLARWEESKRQSNWEKIEKCVQKTRGKIVTYNGQAINAFFHSNSGGTTEVPVNVWGGTNFPYLQVVETSGEDGYTQYSSEVRLSQDELLQKLKTKYENIQIDFNNNEDIKIIEHTDSGRVKTIKFGNHELSGVETRTLLGLRSTNFEITKEAEFIKFTVKGYGHGVGMSQTGANTLAKEGKNCEEIIHHFYTNVEINSI